jgi:hypothetical protein
VKYAWLQEQHAEVAVTSVCRILEVARRGDDEWLGRPPRVHPTTAQQLEAQGTQYGAQGRGLYGTRRIKPL